MKKFLAKARKAFMAGFSTAGLSIGVDVSNVDWKDFAVAAIVGIATYWIPNQPNPATMEARHGS